LPTAIVPIDLAAGRLTARVVDRRATASSREPIDSSRVALGPLDCVKPIVLHAGFLIGSITAR